MALRIRSSITVAAVITAALVPVAVAPPAGAEVTCDDRAPEPSKAEHTYPAPFASETDPAKRYTATMDTSCGKIVFTLDAAKAPKTVNNFVALARRDFYDGLTFHRVVKDFVIQGGDPGGDGTGGPGYTFEDELPSDGYQLGALAMANAGPNTNGSQFFVVTGQAGTKLKNDYSKFGQVTEGLDVAQKLESFGQQDQTPSRKLYIFDVAITES
jgi:cyclophilin family peptidyl-prolyl cis-trans isomerase